MKYSIRLLVVAIVAATACYLMKRGWHATKAPSATAANPTATSAVASPPSDPLATVTASLRSKMRQWLDSQVQDPDDQEGRQRLVGEMLAMLTDENIADIIQSLSPEEMKTEFGVAALWRWMKVEPTAASNWLAAQSGPTPDQITAVAEGWIGNRSGMEQYLGQLPDSTWKQSLVETVGAQTMVRDPRLSVEMAMQMKTGDAQTNLLKAIACAWMSSDPKAVMNWISSVEDPNLSDQLIASAAQSYALTDPAQAATWLVSAVKSEEVIEKAALNIISSWLIKDPQGAADWVAQFPNGLTKAEAIEKVATRWYLTDPDSAGAWLQQLSQIPQSTENNL